MAKKVGMVVGSIRKESFNRKLALALRQLASNALKMEIIEIANLPLYNQDLDDQAHPPQEWVEFREKMGHFDAFLFVTPEYNRSIPAPLKNAIDVGSRPYGKSIWNEKPAAIISSSPGAIGGFGANQHLRQTFVFLNMPCMQQPEAYISQVDKLFDEAANSKNPDTKDFLQKYMASYEKWIQQLTA